ncbi:thioredoxin family protein [Taklimakanibacter deserti]|uniref:thioredoxin family protein n=1 Tax=Taklimakanibacter deserti TaxID=2267839 RepID=UPI000E647E7D
MEGSRHIVCGHCGQVNRLAANRPAHQAQCAKCHQALFAGVPFEVDEATFERHAARNEIPLLVDVWAPWCGPCRAMAPMFGQAARLLEPELRLLKVNFDDARSLSAKLEIRSIPTLLLIWKSKILARHTGVMDTRRIVEWAQENLRNPRSAAPGG